VWVIRGEHAVVRVEQFFQQGLEELFAQGPCIDARLVFEPDLQSCLQRVESVWVGLWWFGSDDLI